MVSVFIRVSRECDFVGGINGDLEIQIPEFPFRIGVDLDVNRRLLYAFESNLSGREILAVVRAWRALATFGNALGVF